MPQPFTLHANDAATLTGDALFARSARDGRPGIDRAALEHRWVVAGERSRQQDDDASEATRALREMQSAGRLSKLLPNPIRSKYSGTRRQTPTGCNKPLEWRIGGSNP